MAMTETHPPIPPMPGTEPEQPQPKRGKKVLIAAAAVVALAVAYGAGTAGNETTPSDPAGVSAGGVPSEPTACIDIEAGLAASAAADADIDRALARAEDFDLAGSGVALESAAGHWDEIAVATAADPAASAAAAETADLMHRAAAAAMSGDITSATNLLQRALPAMETAVAALDATTLGPC